MTTSQERAVIRPYVHEDEENKLVRFSIGKGLMEPLALANFKLSTHPLTLALWVALSSVAVQLLDWWPDPRIGFLGYLKPVPLFAALSLPFIFFFDWYQRPTYNQRVLEALKAPDIVEINNYYSKNHSSGVWLYEFGSNFVGLIAIDTEDSTSHHNDTKVNSNKKSKSSKSSSSSSTSPTAIIRHLYVTEPYRAANAQDDLIDFAIKKIFSQTGKQKIVIKTSPLLEYITSSLKKVGFEVINRGEPVGLIGWPMETYELCREKWVGI